MNAEERAKGLLKLVETYRAQECRELMDRAKAEAREILRRAWRRERDHLHTSCEAERNRARALIQAARAERATRERSSGDRVNAQLLSAAWPLLEQGLLARWADAEGRETWVAQALAGALAALPVGPWLIRHARDWHKPERAAPCVALAEQLAERGAPPPRFQPDGDISAGLIVESGAARFDASHGGLLQDRRRLEARLLSLLAEQAHPPSVEAAGASESGEGQV